MKSKNGSRYYCLRYARSEEMKARRRLVGDNGGIKFQGKITTVREDGCINTLTAVQKDNLILNINNDMATNYNEIELRPDSSVTPLGNCRYDIDGRMIEFAIRKLTPRECFRLMDCDDKTTDLIMSKDENGKQIISNSQCYRMAGNSICVSCLYYLYEQIWYPKESTHITSKQLTLF